VGRSSFGSCLLLERGGARPLLRRSPLFTTRQLRGGATSPLHSRPLATQNTLSTTFNEARALVMAPKQRASAIDESEEDSMCYNWDGSALTRYPLAKHLAKRCYKHDTRFRQHVTSTLSTDTTCPDTRPSYTISRSLDQPLRPQRLSLLLGGSRVHRPLAIHQCGTTTGTAIPADEGKDYTVSLHDCEQIDINLIELILSTLSRTARSVRIWRTRAKVMHACSFSIFRRTNRLKKSALGP
jgi:hypothetical protein